MRILRGKTINRKDFHYNNLWKKNADRVFVCIAWNNVKLSPILACWVFRNAVIKTIIIAYKHSWNWMVLLSDVYYQMDQLIEKYFWCWNCVPWTMYWIVITWIEHEADSVLRTVMSYQMEFEFFQRKCSNGIAF